MTRAEFDQQCQELCVHCKNAVALRQRLDTREWTHDGAIQIPGTLGRRHSHAYCQATSFRNTWKDKLDE